MEVKKRTMLTKRFTHRAIFATVSTDLIGLKYLSLTRYYCGLGKNFLEQALYGSDLYGPGYMPLKLVYTAHFILTNAYAFIIGQRNVFERKNGYQK